jgi:hypothetical protein
MAFQARCDVGGEVEDTDGSTLTMPRLFGVETRAKLPDGWLYMELPMPDGTKQAKVVCPECLGRIWSLFGIPGGDGPTGCVRCGHAPVLHRGPVGCTHKSGCDCTLSEVESTDPGWAQS